MPRFAPVMPISVAQMIQEQDVFYIGSYHLLLAHDVAKNAEAYAEVYSQITYREGDKGARIESNRDPVIIMDNSVIELGSPIDPETMLAAVKATNANVVVLPDYLFSRSSTVESTFQGLTTYAQAIDYAGNCMAVPQGIDFEDWVRCLEELSDEPDINMIGIPKNISERFGVSRKKAVEACAMICSEKFVHMLGFSDNLWDDITATRYGADIGLVMGIDSAAPIWSGFRDNYSLTLSQNIPKKRGTWFENPFGEMSTEQIEEQLQTAINNMLRVEGWLMSPDDEDASLQDPRIAV